MLPRSPNSSTNSASPTHVPIGQWAVRNDECRIQTLLGSCVGVALFDRQGRVGGLAHVVLPDSRGEKTHPGKYADTAIVAMLDDFRKLGSPVIRSRLWAKLAGGASMFRTGPAVGTPERIVETLRGLEGDGMTYAITYFQEAAHDTSGIELFAAVTPPWPEGVAGQAFRVQPNHRRI